MQGTLQRLRQVRCSFIAWPVEGGTEFWSKEVRVLWRDLIHKFDGGGVVFFLRVREFLVKVKTYLNAPTTSWADV